MGRMIRLILLMVMLGTIPVMAQEERKEDWLQEYDFSGLEEFIEHNFQVKGLSFRELVQKLIFEPDSLSANEWLQELADCFWGQAAEHRRQAVTLLILTVCAAVFISFAETFENTSIAVQAWFVIYLMLSSVMLAGFQISFGIVKRNLELIILFMKMLLPSFCLSMVCITGATASGFCYQATFVMIAAVDALFIYAILPLIQLFFSLSVLNGLGGKDRFSGALELIQVVYDWLMKTLIAVIVGLQVIQGLILPMVSRGGPALFSRILSAIPGIGNGVRSTAEILAGTGMLIKNGIGTAGCIILILAGSYPIIQIAVTVLMYYLVGAVVSPVSDERLKTCFQAFTTSNRMLLKTLCVVLFLFFITIAVICAFTNGVL